MSGAREELERALPHFAVRGPTMADVAAATAVIAACETHAHGFAEIVEEEVAESWARPTIDLAGDVVLVLDGRRGRCRRRDLPRPRRRLRPSVAPWPRHRHGARRVVDGARRRSSGIPLAGQTVSDDDDPSAVALLQGLGFTPSATPRGSSSTRSATSRPRLPSRRPASRSGCCSPARSARSST